MSYSPILFDGGTNGVGCDTFIRNVRQRGLREGKESEDKWMAHAAAASMEGDALFWYEDQDEEVQDSWKMLRRALLTRWGKAARAPAVANPPSAVPTGFRAAGAAAAVAPLPAAAPPLPARTGFAPTPAAASPPAAPAFAPSNSASLLSPQTIRRTGRIRVLYAGSNTQFGYVSKFLDVYGEVSTTQQLSDAILVSFNLSRRAHEIEVLNAATDSFRRRLAVSITQEAGLNADAQLSGGRNVSGSLNHATLEPSSGWTHSTQTTGESDTMVWNVLLDGTLVAAWVADHSARYPLDFCVIDSTPKQDRGTIQITNNFGNLSRNTGLAAAGYRLFEVTLVFEQL